MSESDSPEVNLTGKQIGAGCGLLLLSCVLEILGRALLIKSAWAWFVAGPFSLPLIGFATALGIGLLVGYMVNGSKDTPSTGLDDKAIKNWEDVKGLLAKIYGKTLAPYLILGVAYIYHLFQ